MKTIQATAETRHGEYFVNLEYDAAEGTECECFYFAANLKEAEDLASLLNAPARERARDAEEGLR